jgi:hypothetical protein
MPLVYDFVNGCNHSYTFCVTFCSWMHTYIHTFPGSNIRNDCRMWNNSYKYKSMRFNLPGMALPTQGIRTLGHTKTHEVAECNFQHRFSVNMWCGVVGNNLIGPRVIESRLTAPYYRNFPENGLPLHLENVLCAT